MNKMFVSVFAVFLLLIASCSVDNSTQSNEVQENSKSLIVTTFYPVEEITKAMVQDSANVKVLVGAGVEPHSFEPTPQQVVELSKADVFVTMGGMFEHVEEEIINSNLNLKVVDSAHNLELIKGEEMDEGEHEEHGENGEYDPHVWLSIHNMESMTNEIVKQLVEIYPENKELYEVNAQLYLKKLEILEDEFSTKLGNCEYSQIIVNHKAFGYLGHEYGFEQISVAGFSPESEPSPKTIQAVIDEAKKYNLTYIFSEGQLDKKTAQTIASDIGGEVLELNPIKVNNNEDYFSIMRKNLDNLALGLNCQN